MGDCSKTTSGSQGANIVYNSRIPRLKTFSLFIVSPKEKNIYNLGKYNQLAPYILESKNE